MKTTKKPAPDDLSPEERAALNMAANAWGPRWRDELRIAWGSGNYGPLRGVAHILQRIRNTHGEGALAISRDEARRATRIDERCDGMQARAALRVVESCREAYNQARIYAHAHPGRVCEAAVSSARRALASAIVEATDTLAALGVRDGMATALVGGEE